MQNPAIKFLTTDDFWNKNDGLRYNLNYLNLVLNHLEPFRNYKKAKRKVTPDAGTLIVRGPIEENASFGQLCRISTA